MKTVHRILAIVMLFLCLALSACGKGQQNSPIRLEQIALDTPPDAIVEQADSHGGFLGDGVLFVTACYTEEKAAAAEAQINVSDRWKPFPGSAAIKRLLYSDEYRALVTAETKDGAHLAVPRITNGAYCYYNRREDLPDDRSRFDETQFDAGISYNFTLAVYDFDTRLLYYIAADT